MTKHLVNESNPTIEELRQELDEAARDLHCAYARFNEVSDPELVDACIYEIDSVKARYGYLLRRLKELTGCAVRPQPAACAVPSDCAAASTLKGGPICPL